MVIVSKRFIAFRMRGRRSVWTACLAVMWWTGFSYPRFLRRLQRLSDPLAATATARA
jgi:hypothetical protein